MTAELLVGANCVLAGITAFSALACAGIWAFTRPQRDFLWCALLAFVTTATLLAGAVVLARPTSVDLGTSLYVRYLLCSTTALVTVVTASRLLPGLPVRLMRGLAAAVVGCAVTVTLLWWPAGLVVRSSPTAADWPRYGALGWSTAVCAVAPVVVCALVCSVTSGWVRRLSALGGVAVIGCAVLPFLADRPDYREWTTTLDVLPGGAAILVVAARALLGTARARETLVRRQAVLVRVSQAAVTEAVDTLSRRVERELRAELHRDGVVVLVSGLDRLRVSPAAVLPSVRVQGRRQRVVARGLGPLSASTRQFVESLLRVVAAAADRASVDAEFAHRAGHDDVTGLPNLAVLRSRIEDRLCTDSASVLLAVCRLDGLGRIAAVDGPDRMHEAVATAARALRSIRRPGTTIARVDGEAFAVLEVMPGADPDGYLVARLAEIRRSAETGVAGWGGARVGAVVARPGAGAESMIKDAFAAVERAADNDGVAVFDEQLARQLRARAALTCDLLHAVERDEIEVRYQQVVVPRTRTRVSAEALARWRHRDTVMPPSLWIPIAERSGIIHDVGRHVLGVALRDQPRLQVPVAVNVSPLELTDPRFVPDVLAALGDLPPRRLTLEITESAVMADLDRCVAVLEELRARGIRIALDDFGSSYSSLGVLVDLPVDVLKLDRSFVSRIDQARGAAVVEATVALGRALGKPIVAEGVETEAQLARLVALGVDRVQGFLVGRPTTADRFNGERACPRPRAADTG
ncbi:EAL domain, c-di-GMP-specific phosphodiesterase class I (or its enzymatically inactive variant) [Jatrophihabitans endophyticus]|uniref:EAL domain, c-di-GMP-specific phosphodiesterase class I (Or its enzymatically inactive variant) n=1 Tax=Jatrophihabitans endophyticus TaxID=1206085 RepID=A0A1M5BZB9_9ACTN|nr:GGDEF domain-containing phosphodiesterase [Jatrophihabitans endophyticus]SHF47829.1 EAL domain, c-di-GMP-specific phosphodiesterase class I (or its enzymatically inactive variant) [Jatrophihabitans endophyticus]